MEADPGESLWRGCPNNNPPVEDFPATARGDGHGAFAQGGAPPVLHESGHQRENS
jgi:hypothetical protein